MTIRVLQAVVVPLAIFVVTVAAPAGHAARVAGSVSAELKDPTSNDHPRGMAIKPNLATIKAGEVVISAVNRSTTLVHELVVVALDKPGQPLPYDATEDKVDEAKIHSLGEVSELDPGQHGTLTVKLAPGVYALLCNQPGHYRAGMVTLLTVAR